MLLPQQIQAILYHFISGWVYGCTFSFLCSLIVYLRFSVLKACAEIIYHIGFTLLAFYGLYQINGGVTNVYLIVFFMIGIMVYYKWYLPVFQSFFAWFIRLFRPLRIKVFLAKKKIVGIIKVRRKRKEQRRAEHARRKKKNRKEKEKISADAEVR